MDEGVGVRGVAAHAGASRQRREDHSKISYTECVRVWRLETMLCLRTAACACNRYAACVCGVNLRAIVTVL